MNVLIISPIDEERTRLRTILGREDGIRVSGETATRRGAEAILRTHRPDLLLLGTELQDGDGFGVLDKTPWSVRPAIVFIASTGDEARRAFEYQAIDYIVRPFPDSRIEALLRRVRAVVGAPPDHGEHRTNGRGNHTATTGEEERLLDRIVVKTKDRIYFVKTTDVDWIEAAADYVHIHAGGKKHIIREKIGELEKRLDPACFVRIHRSAIVHIDKISELRPLYHGQYQVVLTDRTELTLSRRYRGRLSRHFVNTM